MESMQDQNLSKKEIDDALKLLRELSLVEITSNLVSLHSLTAQFFGETLKNYFKN
jgi:hypothetical protein